MGLTVYILHFELYDNKNMKRAEMCSGFMFYQNVFIVWLFNKLRDLMF